MITRAKFQNFKALRNVEITFDSRLTVIVGPNGSGKTSVLRGLEILCRLLSKPVPAENVFAVSPAISDVFSGDSDNDLVLEASEESGSGNQKGIRIVANLAPKPAQKGRARAACEWAIYTDQKGEVKEYPFGTTPPPDAVPGFSSAELLQLVPAQLAASTTTQIVPPRMASSGNGLPSVLAYLKLYDEERFDEVVKQFRQVIRNVNRIRIDRVQAGGNILGEGLLFDLQTRSGIRAEAMSDGTLYTLGLLTVIFGPHRPKVLLLDDLDHGLHPKAQLTLVGLLREVLDRFPDLQIIATSHSPYILDKMNPNEVRVMVLKDDGSAACARLEDHPKYPMWKDSMSPGEFWTHAGEDWVKNLTPQTAAP